MDDRTQPDRDNASRNRSAPSAPSRSRDDDSHRNGRHSSPRDERVADHSSSGKPALTDRERRERWPVD